MLRRTQPINVKAEPINVKAEEKPETDGRRQNETGAGPFGVDRRQNPRLRFDEPGVETKNAQTSPQAGKRRQPARENTPSPVKETVPGAPVMVERRKAEREKMEAMRAGLQRSAAAKVEERGLGAMLQRAPGRVAFKPSRIVLLLVALVTGGLAAFLATQLNQQPSIPVAEIAAPPVEAKMVAEPRVKILVARKDIGIGQRLSPALVEWKDWPEGEFRPDYITFASMAQVSGDMSSEVARFEIFPGEPIRRQKLVSAEQGYLSAVIERGRRAVSVSITPLSASGGFIVPNDHVDIVLTRDPPNGQVSQTILSNIRVLAINSRLGETGATGAPADPNDPRAEMFADQAIATLELSPSQAEVIISATTLGKLSLVLRSMSDFAQANKVEQSGPNQAIRITSPFWNKALEQVRLQ